ncbi:cholecystokinin receptor-like [Lytechinus pictus]|uniref:cholecystokinin receptor-like n=1 Tax=Lytechinus pictus TaxID=7653 RepID=UPI00240E2440|nr:cholecystokinin receptor-like [Lytechinus pictus]
MDSIFDNGSYDSTCDEFFANVSLDAADLISYSDAQVVITTVLLPIVLVVGLINNIAFIYVVVRVQCMKTITNACLVNLAMSDLLFLTIAIGDKIWAYVHSPITPDHSHLGLIGCIFTEISVNTTYFASLFFVTLVALERFYAVCRPQKERGSAAMRTFRWLLIGSWATAGLLSATFIPAYSKIRNFCALWPDVEPYNTWPTKFQWCEPIQDWTKIYTDSVRAIPFFIAFFINVFLFVGIVRGLNQAVERAKIMGKRDKNVKLRNQITWMLIVNGLVFFLCLAPFEIISIMKAMGSFKSTTMLEQVAMHFAQILAYLNSLINPVIYMAMSTRYRAAFINGLLPAQCRQRWQSLGLQSSTAHISMTNSNVHHEHVNGNYG